ncbi:glucokinase [Pichia californica]|uniref:Phosphotransferase n=1 Tax=Pichia californica TaxID=460514 RepID=A0A9P6WHQ1_9ASCO|nr:glucokinase [[Candida] californica]KAG0687340.1 glucokinase [[Candida] californica]
MNKELKNRVDEICKSFDISQDKLQELVDLFIESADNGLSHNSSNKSFLPMIPTFVTSIPTGKEKGVLLAADLGGTNFRVCSVTLNGDHTFDLIQSKNPIPIDLMSSTSNDLFSYLASKIKSFVKEHHNENFNSDSNNSNKLKLGFTFSFPVEQTSLDSGKLIRWTKGFNIPDTIGKDVVKLLQDHLDSQNVPVHVAALANDTVGTLLARSYTGENKEGLTSIGCIFGTGTNGAYNEKLENIKKLPIDILNDLKSKNINHMVINTEWGSFDNDLKKLPVTKYDTNLDKISANPGYHMFEKRVSGMFLGEILRNILLDLYSEGLLFNKYSNLNDLPHRLKTPWLLSSEGMSLFEIDDSTNLIATELELKNMLRLPTTLEERLAIQQLTRSIARRASHLAAVPISALVIKMDAFKGHNVEVDVGADGSVIEFYPGFRTMMRDAIAETQIGSKGERRLHVNISKDGSSVGAALCALSNDL